MAFYPDEHSRETRKPFVASGEFWLGVFVTLIVLTLIVGFVGWGLT